MEEKKPFVGSLRTSEEKTLFFHGAIGPDGRRIATSTHKNELCIWDADTGEGLYRKRMDMPIMSLEFSPDGKNLMITPSYGVVYFFDMESWEVRDLPIKDCPISIYSRLLII